MKKKKKRKCNQAPGYNATNAVVVSYGWLGDPAGTSFLQMALLGRYR